MSREADPAKCQRVAYLESRAHLAVERFERKRADGTATFWDVLAARAEVSELLREMFIVAAHAEPANHGTVISVNRKGE